MDPNWLKIIFLAVVQGITEFLPISSSGHLTVLQAILEVKDDNVLVTVVLHGGSLCSILAYYARDIWELRRRENWRMAILVVVGTLPAVFLFYPLKKAVDLLEDPKMLGIALCITAVGFVASFFILCFMFKPSEEKADVKAITWLDSIYIGLMQCVALTPGVSRSGSTISMAGRRGVVPGLAAKYSFFLGIAAIGGAMVVKMKDIVERFSAEAAPEAFSFLQLVIGFLVSFAVGYVALAVLIHVLKRGKMKYFGYYCLLMAVVTAIVAVGYLREKNAQGTPTAFSGDVRSPCAAEGNGTPCVRRVLAGD